MEVGAPGDDVLCSHSDFYLVSDGVFIATKLWYSGSYVNQISYNKCLIYPIGGDFMDIWSSIIV